MSDSGDAFGFRGWCERKYINHKKWQGIASEPDKPQTETGFAARRSWNIVSPFFRNSRA
jgi:hypothetical protein